MTAPRRWAPALGALVTLALAVSPAVVAAPAQAQTGAGSARLAVTAMRSVLGPAVDPNPEDDQPAVEDEELRLLVENDGATELTDLRVVAELHRAVNERSTLQAALDDDRLDSSFVPVDVEVRGGGTVAPGEIAGVVVTIPGDRARWSGTDAVYPLKLSVVRGTTVLDQVVTAVVHLTTVPENPLRATVVWPLSAPLERTAEGTYPEALPDALAPGGQLAVLLAAAERHPTAPILLAPDVATLEELADRSDGFTLTDGTVIGSEAPPAQRAAELLGRIRALLDQAPLDPVAGPYAGADVAALASGPEGVKDLARAAVELERSRMQALLGRAPDLATYLATTTLTPQVTPTLPTDTVLLPQDQVRIDPRIEVFSGVPPAFVTDKASGLGMILADPVITRLLDDPPARHGLPLARQRLVAETAMLYLVAPDLSRPRGLLALPPTGWSPDPAAAESILSGLLDAPWLTFSRPAVPAGAPAVDLASSAASLPATVATEINREQQLLEALRDATTSAEGTADDGRIRLLGDTLLRSLTPAALAGGGQVALNRLAEIGRQVVAAFGSVTITQAPRITLTSDTGDIPVTIERDQGGPIDVLIEVESAGRLVWDPGAQEQEVHLSAGGLRTVSFRTRAVSRGTFPVTVTVWDPNRTRVLDTATLSVRSTAISRPALVVIGVVVAGLLAAGALRRRRPKLEVVP